MAAQGGDAEGDMSVEFEAQFLGACDDVFAVHTAREGLAGMEVVEVAPAYAPGEMNALVAV